MEGIIDKWWREVMNISSTSVRLGNLKQRISNKLDYWDRQPATKEFSKGFEHCCKAMREFLLGSESRREK